MSNFAPEQFFSFAEKEHAAIFDGLENVWEALPRIGEYLKKLERGFHGEKIGSPYVGDDVYIGEGTVIEPGAMIKGPAYIGRNCSIRSGCYIRENVIVGDRSTLGNSCEFKNCLLFNNVEAPHFNYVGDSILGYKSHIGAGVILSNVRLDRAHVQLTTDSGSVDTGLRKFGAIIGDHTEVGCNAVLSPGTILGRHCILYPGTQWRGVLAANQIVKLRQQLQVVQRH